MKVSKTVREMQGLMGWEDAGRSMLNVYYIFV